METPTQQRSQNLAQYNSRPETTYYMSTFREHKTIADRAASDRSRHRKKVEKAIKESIKDVVAEESIIGQSGKKKVRIPIKGIKEHQFVYGNNEKNKRVGSAQGKNVKQGQRIGKVTPRIVTGKQHP